MKTRFAISSDGTRIAFEINGKGPALVLLHGGGHDRRSFHNQGYLDRLQHDFTVITVDIRGNGESDKPTVQSQYTTEKHCQDLLAVVDACGFDHFVLLGFSYGGNIGRYLAATSERVTKCIIIGIPFGAAAQGGFRQFIEELHSFWPPILQAQADGTLDPSTLSDEDREYLLEGNVPLTLAWLGAMLDWQPIEPSDLICPTLWLVGSENEGAMASVNRYAEVLNASTVQLRVMMGLNHPQEFSEIEQVLPVITEFIKVP